MLIVLTPPAKAMLEIVAAEIPAVKEGVLPVMPVTATAAKAPCPGAPWKSQSHVCAAPYAKDGKLLVK